VTKSRLQSISAAAVVAAVTTTMLTTLTPVVYASTPLLCTDQLSSSFSDEMQRAYARIGNDPGYTGIALLAPCGPIDVYGPGGLNAGFQATTRGTDPIGDFRFHQVANGLQRLMQVQAAVSADFERLATQGVKIDRYWPDMTTGRERIEVADATTSVLAQLSAAYGPTFVDAVSVTQPVQRIPAYDPSNDSPPWYGADYIEWTDSGLYHLCTEAFGLHNSSSHFLLTAGHCSARNYVPITGETWINAVYNGSSLIGSLGTIGSVVYNSLGGQIDAALIQVSSSNYEWNGWYTSASLVHQYSQARAGVGARVCTNGAYEGTICSGVVQQSGYLGCITVGGFAKPFCETIQATNTSGGVIVGAGDSGGGVTSQGPTLFSHGIISAENNDAKSCPHWTWRGNVCSSTVYFTDLPFVISQMTGYYGSQMYVNT